MRLRLSLFHLKSESSDAYAVLKRFQSNHPRNYFFVSDSVIDNELRDIFYLNSENEESRYKKVQRKILAERTVIPLLSGSVDSGLWGPRARIVPVHKSNFSSLPFETIEVAPSDF